MDERKSNGLISKEAFMGSVQAKLHQVAVDGVGMINARELPLTVMAALAKSAVKDADGEAVTLDPEAIVQVLWKGLANDDGTLRFTEDEARKMVNEDAAAKLSEVATAIMEVSAPDTEEIAGNS